MPELFPPQPINAIFVFFCVISENRDALMIFAATLQGLMHFDCHADPHMLEAQEHMHTRPSYDYRLAYAVYIYVIFVVCITLAVCSNSGIFHMPRVDSLDEIIPHHCSTRTRRMRTHPNKTHTHTHTNSHAAPLSHLSRPMRKVAQCSASGQRAGRCTKVCS